MTKFLGIAIMLAFVSLLTIQQAEASCWTYGDCARKCARGWKGYGYASAQDCVARHPCSQYPRKCGGSSGGSNSGFEACMNRGVRAGWTTRETSYYCNRHR